MMNCYVSEVHKVKIAPNICHVLWNKPAGPLCLTSLLSLTIGRHVMALLRERNIPQHPSSSSFLKTRLRSVSCAQRDKLKHGISLHCSTELRYERQAAVTVLRCWEGLFSVTEGKQACGSWMRKQVDWTVHYCVTAVCTITVCQHTLSQCYSHTKERGEHFVHTHIM